MSDEKSFYYMRGNVVTGPVKFSNIEESVTDGLLSESTLIHPDGHKWIPYNKYITLKSPNPSDFSSIQSANYENTAPTSTPAQICFILAFALLAIGLVGAVMASSVHMAIGGISSLIFWGIIGLILRAAAIQADKRTESIIKAIRGLKEE